MTEVKNANPKKHRIEEGFAAPKPFEAKKAQKPKENKKEKTDVEQ